MNSRCMRSKVADSDSYEPTWRICTQVPSVRASSRTWSSAGLGCFSAAAAAASATIASVIHSGWFTSSVHSQDSLRISAKACWSSARHSPSSGATTKSRPSVFLLVNLSV
jgi:hypothetical protein